MLRNFTLKVLALVTALLAVGGLLIGSTDVAQASASDTSTGAVIGPATTSAPALTSGRATTSSTTPLPKVNRVDTDATRNHPGLILGSAAVALVLLGGGAVIARRRLTDDDH